MSKIVLRSRQFWAGIFLLSVATLIIPTTAQAIEVPASEIQSGIGIPVQADVLTSKYGCIRRSWIKRWQFGWPPVYWAVDAPDGYQNMITAAAYGLADSGAVEGHVNPTEILFCPKDIQKTLVEAGVVETASFVQGERVADPTEQAIIAAVNGLLYVVALVGVWALSIASYFLGSILGAGSFTTHPMVQQGWPFIQGIANLGFIIALLFIAAATTLRIESWGIRRMLPRLLLAALVINFSLVIGAVIIDASRLLMAVLVRAAGIETLGSIAGDLLRGSSLITGVFKPTTFGAVDTISLIANNISWGVVFEVLRATILVWALALAFAIISIGLLTRHIVLILLLIVSPLAYLSLAFPSFENKAQQWWSQFLKWVIYGPVVLFILVLLVHLNNAKVNFFNENKVGASFFEPILTVGVSLALAIVAVKAGSMLGGVGGAAAINFATGQGKNALRGRGIAGMPVATSLWAGKKTAQYAGERTGINAYLAERQKQKQKKKEEKRKDQWGTRAAQYQYASPEKRERMDRERSWSKEVSGVTDATHAALAPERLQSKEVGRQVKAPQINAIIDRARASAGTADQIRSDTQLEAMLSNPEVMDKMAPGQTNSLVSEFRGRMADAAANMAAATTAGSRAAATEQKNDARRLLDRLNTAMRDAVRRAESK